MTEEPAIGSIRDTLLEITRYAEVPCWSVDPELFFAESPAGVAQAKTICLPCPARQACLAGALERREPCGVWGGELIVNGRIVPIKRGRGRPRKHSLAPEPPGRAA